MSKFVVGAVLTALIGGATAYLAICRLETSNCYRCSARPTRQQPQRDLPPVEGSEAIVIPTDVVEPIVLVPETAACSHICEGNFLTNRARITPPVPARMPLADEVVAYDPLNEADELVAAKTTTTEPCDFGLNIDFEFPWGRLVGNLIECFNSKDEPVLEIDDTLPAPVVATPSVVSPAVATTPVSTPVEPGSILPVQAELIPLPAGVDGSEIIQVQGFDESLQVPPAQTPMSEVYMPMCPEDDAHHHAYPSCPYLHGNSRYPSHYRRPVAMPGAK